MLIKPLKKIESPRIELIPLLDVFFLILIFFFYSIFHLVEEKGIPVNLATASSSVAQNDTQLLIVIDKSGRYLIDNDFVNLDAIKNRFSKIDQNNNVLIRSDQNSPVGASIKILNLARENNLKQISLQTKQEPEVP